MIIVDAFSKWSEVIQMATTTAKKTRNFTFIVFKIWPA